MSKTTEEILGDEWNLNEKKGITSEEYRNLMITRWYSEEEVDKIIEQVINAKINVEDFKKTGIIKCPTCNKKFIKINEYNWKPDCGCFKNKNISLSIG